MLGTGSISEFPISALGAASAPTSVPYVATLGSASLRRRNTTRRVLRQLDQAESTPLAPSRGVALLEPFSTHYERSRRVQAAGWISALAPVVPPPFPYVAIESAKSLRRRNNTRRVLRQIDLLESSPLAPSRFVALAEPFTTNVERSRRFQTASWLASMAPAPAAVVPASAYHVPTPRRARKSTCRVRRDLAAMPTYTFAPVTPNTDRSLSAAFITNVSRSRKLQATPALVISTGRPAVPLAAILAPTVNRRKPGETGFFFVDVVAGTCGTAAVYPSFVPTGFIYRRATTRTLKRALIAPVFPANPPPSTSRSLSASFVTNLTRSRRLQTLPPLVIAAPQPVPPYVRNGSWGKSHRRTKQREFDDERAELRAAIAEAVDPVREEGTAVAIEAEVVHVTHAAAPAIDIPVPPSFDAEAVARLVAEAVAEVQRLAQEEAARQAEARALAIIAKRRRDDDFLLLMD